MTLEQRRRVDFLRAHGSFSKRETRERMLQQHESEAVIAKLKAQLRDYEGHNDERSLALRMAWTVELRSKLELLLKLKRNQPVPPGRVKNNVNGAEVLQRLATGTLQRAQLFGRTASGSNEGAPRHDDRRAKK